MANNGDALEAGREAVARYAWAEAFEHFTTAAASAPLGPEDLDRMAQAAWWIGKMRDCIALREKAYAAFLDSGDVRSAARMAIELADHHGDLAEGSVASAWINRAAMMLDDQPEGPEHAHLKLAFALAARGEGDLEKSGALAAESAEIAGRHGDKDLMALALSMQGTGLVMMGDVDRGMAMVEEATVGAVSGELGPHATGWIYCMMITVASQVADWQRAGQWTEAAKRWCDRQAINGFPGVCRIHRAEIMRLRGALSEAEEEARTATVELGSFNFYMAALAFKELGEVRLKMGDIDAAEEAFGQANEMGVTPQPGLALVQLHRGKPQAAASALKRALSEEHLGPLDRAKLLPSQLEVALTLGDIDTARAAASDLGSIAERHRAPAMQATAKASAAAVAFVDGDVGQAEGAAKQARRLYKEVDLTYEAARVSLLLGEIYHAEGDTDAAEFEIRSGLSTFEKIGAVLDAERARELLDKIGQPVAPHGRRVAKTFLFSDIVKSTNLLEAIGDDAWTDLLKWHDETLREQFGAHKGEEVQHTGDGFFVAFADADSAVACAIAIQRSLAEHRRAHGFSPQVRIGLHATEASAVGSDYRGKGVHEAARIGALAEGGEILVSASSLDCVSAPVKTTDERTVPLKGVAEPVPVVSVVWRD